jgi:acetyltransferase-like isoleucine patch superfamily enzyme
MRPEIIKAKKLNISELATFGKNIDIQISGTLTIGDHSIIGNNCKIRGHNITIGKHFYNTDGLKVGGGGCNTKESNLTIGDRCTIHNSYINLAKEVNIGNDVGLSNHVDIITHGFWQSVLEGYPNIFKGVNIGNNVIVGYRSIINPGVNIADNIVIGSGSVVTKDLQDKGIYGGVPARFIKEIKELTWSEKEQRLTDILKQYIKTTKGTPHIKLLYPVIVVNDFVIDIYANSYKGKEDKYTDDLRDYLRRYGIRIYTNRPFKSL